MVDGVYVDRDLARAARRAAARPHRIRDRLRRADAGRAPAVGARLAEPSRRRADDGEPGLSRAAGRPGSSRRRPAPAPSSPTAAAGFARPQHAALHRRVDDLVRRGGGGGNLARPSWPRLFNARLIAPAAAGRARGSCSSALFVEATRALCARSIAACRAATRSRSITLDECGAQRRRSPSARSRGPRSYLRQSAARGGRPLGSRPPVVTISFIPSEETRTRSPRSIRWRASASSRRFPEFLPIMKAGVQRFAPACRAARRHGAAKRPSSRRLLRRVDVVVYASGAEQVSPHDRPGIRQSNTATPPIPPRSSACCCRRSRNCAPARCREGSAAG